MEKFDPSKIETPRERTKTPKYISHRPETNSVETLDFLIQYIIYTLNELYEAKDDPNFNECAYLAYMECLEVVSSWKGFKKYGILDIESDFALYDEDADNDDDK